MRRSSDDGERLQGALAAIDGVLFGGSPKDRFDLNRTGLDRTGPDRTGVDRPNHDPRASDLKTLSQRIQKLDEFYGQALAEIKGLRK
jgi:hypothetical protein